MPGHYSVACEKLGRVLADFSALFFFHEEMDGYRKKGRYFLLNGDLFVWAHFVLPVW